MLGEMLQGRMSSYRLILDHFQNEEAMDMTSFLDCIVSRITWSPKFEGKVSYNIYSQGLLNLLEIEPLKQHFLRGWG